MILSLGDITRIIKENPNKAYVKAVQDYAEVMTMHNTGAGLSNALAKIDYFEKPELLALRQKYSPSNKDFMERLHRPIDKVYSAKGGSVNYYLSPEQKKTFTDYLSDITDGYSLRKWLETYWLPAYNYNPMGMVFIEVGEDKAYPTFKSCNDVYDYPAPKGRKFDYIIFKSDKRIDEAQDDKTKFYRVVDDAWDYLVKWDGTNAQVVEDESYPNYFKTVPAITVSDIWDNVNNCYISPDDNIADIAMQHLRDRSVLTMFKLHHGFPIKWQYQGACPTCSGVGQLSGADCPSCNGSGKKTKYDVSETLALPVPQSKDDPIIAPDVAGYVTPPVETWSKMDETIAELYSIAHYTLWGTHQTEDSSANETATGRFIDVQPVNDRLFKYSNAAEYVESWITDKVGLFMFDAAYKGCDINLGRRYLLETPEAIWEKYENARGKGAPQGTLDNLLIQYLQSEWQGDNMQMLKQLMLMKLEPFVHLTMSDAKLLVVDVADYQKKLYFNQWVNQLGENDLINKDYKTLAADLDKYVNGIVAKQPKMEDAVPVEPPLKPKKKVTKKPVVA